MRKRSTNRYCADPEALSAMKRDGLGWGHDLECGCFEAGIMPSKPGVLARVFKKIIGRK